MLKILNKCIELKAIIKDKCKTILGFNNDIHVYSLAPNIPNDNKEYKIYESYLKCAFKDPNIKNIAITGNYGVGKSSFLKWFSRKKKYLFVSLCSFDQYDQDKGSLECNLIQQILIGCKPTGVRKYAWKFVLYIVILVISSLIIYSFFATNRMSCLDIIDDHFSNFDVKKLVEEMKFYVYSITGILFFICTPVLLTWAMSVFSLKKFSFKAADIETELELDKTHDFSLINFHRMELVDTLIRSAKKFDYTVVFEDMDRLKRNDCISLFTELREINRLVNLSSAKLHAAKHTVRFIYVFHDAVFSAEENTGTCDTVMYQRNHLKFFDYIMPIVPRILHDAASNYIRVCFEKINFHHTVEFISIIDKEIDDYRIIRNIANEYCVIRDMYKERSAFPLNENDEKHILALAVYKTLMPQDYQQIRMGRSILQFNKSSSKYKCIRRLLDNDWLCKDCLKYIGLNEIEIEKYIESLFMSEQLEEKSEVVRNILEEKYITCRNLLLQEFNLPYDKIIKCLGFSLLSLELTYYENDLSIIKKLCKISLLTTTQITEDYTNATSNTLMNYFNILAENNSDEQILNVSTVFEYLLSFCSKDSKCFLDCDCASGEFFIKCYLSMSETYKDIIRSNGLMVRWLNNIKKDPSALERTIQLLNSDEVKRLLEINGLDQALKNSLHARGKISE